MRHLNKCREPNIEGRLTCSIVGTAAALLGSALIGGGTSILGGLFGKSAAQKAAETQSQAAKYAADLQHSQFEETRQDQQPWLQAGQFGLNQLMAGLAPGGSLSTPYGGTFAAPTADEARQAPGYEFTRDQGMQGILRGATASGGAFTTGTLKSLDRFNSGLADTFYGNRFDQKLKEYNTLFNTYNTNQTNQFNRLASLSGAGQTAANELATVGANAANAQGGYLTEAANARAAGTIGSTNAINAALGGVANSASGYANLTALLRGFGPSSSSIGAPGNPMGSAIDPKLLQG